MKLKTYIVAGEHPTHPTVRHHVALTMEAAVEQAVSMVSIIADDVDGLCDDDAPAADGDVTADNWQDRLLWAQARWVVRERLPALSYAEARAMLEAMSSEERYQEAEFDVWIETHEVEAPATITVWHAAYDGENGTETDAFASERELHDWLFGQVGKSRDEFEAFMRTGFTEFDGDENGIGTPLPADERDLDEFLRQNCDHLDTWSWSYREFPIPGIGQAPRVVVGVDGGLVQGASADVPIELFVVDYDTDSFDEDNKPLDIPQSGGGTAEGYLVGHTVAVDPEWTSAIAAFDAENGE